MIDCTDEFVDFFFMIFSAFKFAKIYNIFGRYDLFHYPFYSNENLLLIFYIFFFAIL